MIIYKITNKVNNKTYIGQTTKSLSIRFAQHCQKSSKCTGISTAIQKYGKENFIIEEIGGANNQSELNYQEWLLINKYNTIAPNGYNLVHGGNSKGTLSIITRQRLSASLRGRVSPNKGKKLSEEHKKSLSKAHIGIPSACRGRSLSEEHKLKLSKILKNKPNKMKGRKHSLESRHNMSQGSIGQKGGMSGKRHAKKSNIKNAISNGAKPFIVKNNNTIVWSGLILSECAKELKLSIGNISECLRGNRKTHKGYVFTYI